MVEPINPELPEGDELQPQEPELAPEPAERLEPQAAESLDPEQETSLEPTDETSPDSQDSSSLEPTEETSLDAPDSTSLEPTDETSLEALDSNSLEPTDEASLEREAGSLEPADETSLEREETTSLESTDETSLDSQGDTSLEPDRGESSIEELAAVPKDGTLVDIEPSMGPSPQEPEPAAEIPPTSHELPEPQPVAAALQEPEAPGSGRAAAVPEQPPQPSTEAAPGPAQGPRSILDAGPISGGHPVAPFGGKIMVGTRIGQIEVTGVLGRGGMGEVFRGYHSALDIGVALKILPDELSRNELVRQRFLREARLCVKLDHPHIVRVYNVDEYAGNLYLVMELVDGADAAAMLKQGGRFQYRRALEICAACAEALAYSHSQGLVHRDVKPHNILLSRVDGKIKLSDFGLARAASSSSHLTMSGQIMGTPHYMSPEQAESKEVSDKSDVYSLGISLYHMLTGETPFTGDTPISVAVQHIAKEVLFPASRFEAFPKELVAVLKRMTLKDAEKRCSAKQAAVWLRKLLAMAPSDIEAEPQMAGALAPVVQESKAFEAAAREREKEDERARVLAQTLMATMQEAAMAKTPVGPPKVAGHAPPVPSSSQIVVMPPQGGSGGLIAVLLVIILAGGAVAGWYFLYGPGAPSANAPMRNTRFIAGSGNQTAPGPVNNRPTNDPRTNNGAPTNNGPAANSGTDPDPEDEIISRDLAAIREKIGGATTLKGLAVALTALDNVRLDLGSASPRQTELYHELRSRYNVRFASLSASLELAALRSALDAFDGFNKVRDLNDAILADKRLRGLSLPDEVKEAIDDEVATLRRKLAGALQDFVDPLLASAERLAGEKMHDQAVEVFDRVLLVELEDARRASVVIRRDFVACEGALFKARSELTLKRYREAQNALSAAREREIPDDLLALEKEVSDEIAAAIESALSEYLNQVIDNCSVFKFKAGRTAIERAGELPLSSEQTVRLAEHKVYIDLGEPIQQAAIAVQAGKLNEAAKALAAANEIIDNRTSAPEDLIKRRDKVTEGFDSLLATTFEALLTSAEASLAARAFEKVGDDVRRAGALPLTEAQRLALEEFKLANKTALQAYVSGLMDQVATALDDNDFEKAKATIATIDSLPVPESEAERLASLHERFNVEAVRQHDKLAVEIRAALDSSDFNAARELLDKLALIPVVGAKRKERPALEKRFLELLVAAAAVRFDAFDQLLAEAKFEPAKREIDRVMELPLTSELSRKAGRKLEDWGSAVETAFADLLRRATDARAVRDYQASRRLHSKAGELPLSQEQLLRLSKAQDSHKSHLKSWTTKLFRDLAAAVDKGNEKGGKEIVALLKKIPLSAGQQLKLRSLKASLIGELRKTRIARMPNRLKGLANDAYLQSEQLMDVGEEVTALFASADGRFAIAGTESGKIYFYNLKRGTLIGQSSGGSRDITAVAISANGRLAACGNDDGNVVLFNLSTRGVKAHQLKQQDDDIEGLAFSPSGGVLYVLDYDGLVVRYNTGTRAKVGTTKTGVSKPKALALDRTGKKLAVGGVDSKIALFDALRMVRIKMLQGPGDDQIQRVSFSQDSKLLIAGSIEDDIAIWDLTRLTKKSSRKLKGLSEWVRGVGFSQDGKRACAFDNEYRIIVWDTRTARELKKVKFSKLEGKKDLVPISGFIGADGTVLIGTDEGEIIHLTLKSAR